MTAVGNPGFVIVGTVGAQSTLEAISLCEDAAQHGGDFGLVLPPGYYASALTTASILEFYNDVRPRTNLCLSAGVLALTTGDI